MSGSILCVGSCVLDKVYELESLPRPGQKVLAVNIVERGGGPAATAAVAIARLGAKAAFSGIIGDDPAGHLIHRKLVEHGVDTKRLITDPGSETLCPVVLVDQSGERIIIIQRRRNTSQVAFDNIESTSLLLADTRWTDGAEAALTCAKRAKIPIVLDADGGDRELLQRLVALADHAVFSQQGLVDFAGNGTLEGQLRNAASFCAGVVGVTLGAEGSFWLVGSSVRHVKAYEVAVRDTTGCGDVFHGAYALAISQRMLPLQAAEFASAAAALKAARGMGWDGMPNRESVEQMVKSRT